MRFCLILISLDISVARYGRTKSLDCVLPNTKKTLADIFLDNDCTLSPDTCSKIENGIAHLHSLGLVHNDLNPANIMFSEDDIPEIIDFDSCRREGENLLKAGTPGWSDESAIVADRANDYYGLKKIKEAISRLQKGNKRAG